MRSKAVQAELDKMDKTPKKRSRGSVNNKGRLAAFAKKGKAGQADWGTCSGELLLSVIVGMTRLGGAVTIGLSRDQGAHSLTLLLDDSRETLWFNGDADLDEELRDVKQVIAGM